ncbi:alanine racemase, partial [Escherichia coli]|uniref:alanine racemase n=1 Tax=Escherichia coli TaxID=562 RepID=UPI003F269639
RPEELGPLNICLQVNISAEASKSGLTPEELPEVAAQVAQLPRLRLRGLMAIPAPWPEAERRRDAFVRMRTLFQSLAAQHPQLDTL